MQWAYCDSHTLRPNYSRINQLKVVACMWLWGTVSEREGAEKKSWFGSATEILSVFCMPSGNLSEVEGSNPPPTHPTTHASRPLAPPNTSWSVVAAPCPRIRNYFIHQSLLSLPLRWGSPPKQLIKEDICIQCAVLLLQLRIWTNFSLPSVTCSLCITCLSCIFMFTALIHLRCLISLRWKPFPAFLHCHYWQQTQQKMVILSFIAENAP